MKQIDYLLSINGYREIISETYDDKIEIIDQGDELPIRIDTEKNKPWYKKNPYIRIINIMYTVFIICIRALIPIYTIYKTIYNKDISILTMNFTYYIFIVQYVAGYLYFKHYHFDDMINKYEINSNKIVLFNCLISLALVIIVCAVVEYDGKFILFSELFSSEKIVTVVFTYLLLIIEKFISYLALITNMSAFISVIISHKREIDNFLSEFKNKLDSPIKIDINTIMIEFSSIKSAHSKSIDHLNLIFTSLITMCVLSAYFLLLKSPRDISVVHYINITISLICILAYLYIINQLKQVVTDIKRITNSTRFISAYCENCLNLDVNEEKINNWSILVKKMMNTGDGLSEQERNLSLKIYISSVVNTNLLEWTVINTKLSDNWNSFQFFGFTVDDTVLLQRTVFIIGSFFMLSNIPV